MSLEVGNTWLSELDGDELEALLLEAGDNLSDESALSVC